MSRLSRSMKGARVLVTGAGSGMGRATAEVFAEEGGHVAVTDHALTRVVAQLRRVLGDDARDGRYIETVPTRGYRWIPKVEAYDEAPQTPARAITPAKPLGAWAVACVVAIVFGVVAWTERGGRTEPIDLHAALPRDLARPLQLTTNAGLDIHPSFSPQGDAVAFASDRSGTFELYVRALSGTAAEVKLTGDGQHNVQPAWSPDGSLMAFHSHGRGGIWVMPARGGPARQLAAEGSHPAWSADGRRIAFQSDETSDVTPSAFGAQSGATIKIVNADGSGERQLTTAGQPLGGHASPAWTRDGRFVAFTVFEGAFNNGVWLASVDTGDVTPLLKGVRGLYERLSQSADDLVVEGVVQVRTVERNSRRRSNAANRYESGHTGCASPA